MSKKNGFAKIRRQLMSYKDLADQRLEAIQRISERYENQLERMQKELDEQIQINKALVEEKFIFENGELKLRGIQE